MKNLDIYVIRVDKTTGNLRDSKPCCECIKYLKRAKLFRYCFYSDANGEIVRTRLDTLSNKHKTRGHRDVLRRKK